MRKIIAAACDGVLLDFSAAYQKAWEVAFGYNQDVVYQPKDRFDLSDLDESLRDKLEAVIDSDFWASLPAVENALDACQQLDAAGFDIYVVTALPFYHVSDRFSNLVNEGFPIKDILATDAYTFGDVSPKAEAIAALRPVAFTDSYVPNFKGIPRSATHAALINMNKDISLAEKSAFRLVDSSHADLYKFVDWWLNGAGNF